MLVKICARPLFRNEEHYLDDDEYKDHRTSNDIRVHESIKRRDGKSKRRIIGWRATLIRKDIVTIIKENVITSRNIEYKADTE